MNQHDEHEDALKALLKAHGTDQPSDQFTHHLSAHIIHAYRKRIVALEYPAHRWLGSCIATLLIGCNIVAFYSLVLRTSQPLVVISIALAVPAVAGAVWVARKTSLTLKKSP